MARTSPFSWTRDYGLSPAYTDSGPDEPSHFLTAAESWSKTLKTFTSAFPFFLLSFSFFRCFKKMTRSTSSSSFPVVFPIYIFVYSFTYLLFFSPAKPQSSSSSSSQASSWKDYSPPLRLFASKLVSSTSAVKHHRVFLEYMHIWHRHSQLHRRWSSKLKFRSSP